MNCACHKMIEAVILHGFMEIILYLSQCTEGTFSASICCWHNQNLDQGHDLRYEGPDLFLIFL